jgi:hypothetical protein
MFSAAQGKSNLGIPKSVGQDFVNASAGKPTSPLPEYVQAQQGAKAKKTHRGRRSKGKGAKALHQEGKQHMATALKASTPGAALPHLFAAVRAMHAAKQASAPAAPSDNDGDEPMPV